MTDEPKDNYTASNVAKALGAFVVALASTAALLLADANFVNVVPPWVVAVLGTLVTAGVIAGAVFKIPNTLTPGQVVKGAIDGGEEVVDKVIKEAEKAGIPVPAVVNQTIDDAMDTLKQLPDLTNRKDVEDLLAGLKKPRP